MLLIVAHHSVVNSGVIQEMAEDGINGNSLFAALFGMWGKTGINCFVLITGYFMCKSHITVQKFLKLVLEVLFYNVVIFALFCLFNVQDFTLKDLLKAIVPVKQLSRNFVGCYIVFFLLIPCLNVLIRSLTKIQHIYTLGVVLFFYSLFGTVGFVEFNYVTWFVILYLVSSFIRLYKPLDSFNTVTWSIVSFFCILVSAASVVALLYCSKTMGKDITLMLRLVQDSNTLFAFATGLSLFMLFKGINIQYSGVINAIGASTFGVLLIHANSDTMRQWLWKDLLDSPNLYHSANYMLKASLAVLAIFFVCVVIDRVRIALIEKPMFNMLNKHFSVHFDKLNRVLAF